MSVNKFEKKLLKEIDSTNKSMNILQEFIGLGFLKIFTSSKLKKATKGLKSDPEFKAAIEGMKYHSKEIVRQALEYQKEHGKDPWVEKILKKYEKRL